MAPKDLNKYTVKDIVKIKTVKALKALEERDKKAPRGEGLRLPGEAYEKLQERLNRESGPIAESSDRKTRSHGGGTRRRKSKRGTRRH